MRLCKCGVECVGKATRCKACHAAYVRSRRATRAADADEPTPRITLAWAEFEDLETGSPAFFALVAPNDAALADGWCDKSYGPFATEDEARAKCQFVCEALDVYNQCTSGDVELEVA